MTAHCHVLYVIARHFVHCHIPHVSVYPVGNDESLSCPHLKSKKVIIESYLVPQTVQCSCHKDGSISEPLLHVLLLLSGFVCFCLD